VQKVRSGAVVAVAAQAGLLAALAAGTGLGAVGRLAGLAYGLVLAALLPAPRLGPADRVTLARAVLAGGVTALVADSAGGPVPVRVLVPLTAVALALDAVDGRVARWTGTSSASGARFDMEVDAFLILVLSVAVAGSLGGWVLAIGLMRYAYGAAGRVLPWLPGPLPPRYWRKVVAAVQGVALTAAASGLLTGGAATALVAASLGLLAESFGRDVAWRWRHRAAPGGGAGPLPRPRDGQVGAVGAGGGARPRPAGRRGLPVGVPWSGDEA
jgi:phosphatidylglycerophosphate synthase